jgi:hypothetical protein
MYSVQIAPKTAAAQPPPLTPAIESEVEDDLDVASDYEVFEERSSAAAAARAAAARRATALAASRRLVASWLRLAEELTRGARAKVRCSRSRDVWDACLLASDLALVSKLVSACACL